MARKIGSRTIDVRNPALTTLDKYTSLDTALQMFLTDRRQRLSVETLKWYASQIGSYVRWLKTFRNTRPSVEWVTSQHVVPYVTERKAVSEHTYRASVVSLKAFASWLVKKGALPADALAGVAVPRVPDASREALSDAERALVVEASAEGQNGLRDNALVMTLLGCGLRLNECRELRLMDLNWVDGTVRVRAATSKSRKDRLVTLWPETADAVHRYIRFERRGSESATAQLFTTRDGRPLTREGIQRVFTRLKKLTGIGNLSPHVCRHTWAWNYRRAGSGDILDLREEGGWAETNFRMLMRYSQVKPAHEKRQAPSPFTAGSTYTGPLRTSVKTLSPALRVQRQERPSPVSARVRTVNTARSGRRVALAREDN